MYLDENIKLRQEDLVVVLVCDGYDKIPDSFKEYAREHQFLDENILVEKGFMEEDRDGKLKMKPLEDVVDKKCKNIPKNLLHMFQLCTWDFGLEGDELKGRRINFVFAIKHKNDGKINSHKWFF